MSGKLKVFFKSLKWFEWIPFVEASAFFLCAIVRAIIMAINGSKNFFFILGYLGFVMLLVIFDFALPLWAARICIKKGRPGFAKFIHIVTPIFYGIIGLIVSIVVLLKKLDLSIMPKYWVNQPYQSLVFAAQHKCGNCGLPAPDSVTAGDTCINCNTSWGATNMIQG